MVRWFNMLVHTVFPCEVTAGGVKIQHIPDLMSRINVWAYAQSGTLLQYVLLILPFSSHQSYPPSGLQRVISWLSFSKAFAFIFCSCVPNMVQFARFKSPTFLVPVPWTGSFDHSFSPAPYQLTHGPVLAHEPGLGCLSCREFQRGFLIMIWWVFKVLVTQFELQFDKNVTLFNRKLQTRHCFNNWWSYFLMFYSSGK